MIAIRLRMSISATTLFLILACTVLHAQVYSPGDGVTAPRVVRSTPMTRPSSEVIIECVIQADGTFSAPRFVRSGSADDNASVLSAVAQWQFQAGTKDGRPVAVRFYLSFPRSR